MNFKEWKILRESMGAVPLIATNPQIIGLIKPNQFEEAKKKKKVEVEEDETGDGETVEPASVKDKDCDNACKMSKKKSKKKMWSDNDDQPMLKKPKIKIGKKLDDEEPAEDDGEGEEMPDEDDDDLEGDEDISDDGGEEMGDEEGDEEEPALKKPMKKPAKEIQPMFSKKKAKKEAHDIYNSVKNMMSVKRGKFFDGISEDSVVPPVDPNNGLQTINPSEIPTVGSEFTESKKPVKKK